MKTKVWLSIEPQILAEAQHYAKVKKLSFSKVVEDQLRLLVNAQPGKSVAKPGEKQSGAPKKPFEPYHEE